ncbi:hypothetical protein HPB47_023170, partial [Ixodes persulcatus]
DTGESTFLSALHQLGFTHLGRWIVSTSVRTVKAAALRFYGEIAESTEFFLALFSWNYLTTVAKNKLYWDTVSAMFPPPVCTDRHRSPMEPRVSSGQAQLLIVMIQKCDFLSIRFGVRKVM